MKIVLIVLVFMFLGLYGTQAHDHHWHRNHWNNYHRYYERNWYGYGNGWTSGVFFGPPAYYPYYGRGYYDGCDY